MSVTWGVEREDYHTEERRRKLNQSQPRLNWWPIVGYGLGTLFCLFVWWLIVRVVLL